LHPDNLNKEISFEQFKTAFVDVMCDVKKFVFCGDVGDPIYCTDLIKIVEYIKQSSSAQIVIITNGSYKKEEWWAELGNQLTEDDSVTFSIDGWDHESNIQYRVNSDWDSIMLGVKTLRKNSQCNLKWSAICFSFNETKIGAMADIAKELGFDEFHYVFSTKFDGRYLVNGVDSLKPKATFSKSGQYETYKIIMGRKSRFPAITTHPDRHEWAKCIKCQKDMFINVEGLVFPCPWFNSGYQENDFVEKHKDLLNIKTRSLKDVLSDPIWGEFVTRLETMPLEVCRIKCYESR
jgi:MoaA/NifB/PqqE/SkfB family radical SAM enzyme